MTELHFARLCGKEKQQTRRTGAADTCACSAVCLINDSQEQKIIKIYSQKQPFSAVKKEKEQTSLLKHRTRKKEPPQISDIREGIRQTVGFSFKQLNKKEGISMCNSSHFLRKSHSHAPKKAGWAPQTWQQAETDDRRGKTWLTITHIHVP